MNRREFVTLVGVGGAIACSPEIVSAATEKTKQKQHSDGFVPVGTVAELESKQSLYKKTSLGPILLIKEANSANITAVNPTCTHEGCTVKWNTEKNILVCPCHKAAFTATGVVKKGPAKKDLATYQVKVEGDKILVKA